MGNEDGFVECVGSDVFSGCRDSVVAGRRFIESIKVLSVVEVDELYFLLIILMINWQ